MACSDWPFLVHYRQIANIFFYDLILQPPTITFSTPSHCDGSYATKIAKFCSITNMQSLREY